MSRNYNNRQERRRGGGLRCLGCLVGIVWIVLLGLVGYRYFIQPQLSAFIGRQLAERAPSNTVNDQISQQGQQALPTVVAALPSGELRISQDRANEFLAARGGSFGPIDSINIRFVSGEVQADITAVGTTSTARMGLAVQNGRIIAVNPQLDGILGQFINLADLTGTFEQQLNDQLAAQGRRVSDVRIDPGELVLTVTE
jgi:hypothetical protein